MVQPQGCYDAISLQPCVPGSIVALLKKGVSKTSEKEQEMMGGVIPKEKLQLAAYLVTVCSTQNHLHTGRLNFSLLSLSFSGPAVYRAFEKEYQF